MSVHGIVLRGFKEFVVGRSDRRTWRDLHEAAGLEPRLYVPLTEYPDETLASLIDAAADRAGADEAALLAAFGRALAPQLLSTFDVHVDEGWSALELIANVEEYIHEALRTKRVSEFAPPTLRSRRLDEERIAVAYESDRRLCPFARGILVGIGDDYDRSLRVGERRCVRDGASRCEFVVSGAEQSPTVTDAGTRTTADSPPWPATDGPDPGRAASRTGRIADHPTDEVGVDGAASAPRTPPADRDESASRGTR